MPNSSFESSRADEPELMKKSKARPPSGDLDYSKFAPRKGGSAPDKKPVYDTSTYLEKTREEDPWPDQAKEEAIDRKVEIVSVEFPTKEEEAAFDHPIKVRCVAKVTKSPPAPGLKISLQWRAVATDPWKELGAPKTVTIEDKTGEQTFEVELDLTTPDPTPEFGQKIFYGAKASHDQAEAKEASPREIAYKASTDFVGSPDIVFPKDSLLPRLDKDATFARALAAFLKQVASKGKGAGDVAVVFGFSQDGKGAAANREISDKRAKLVKALLDRDERLWESVRRNVSIGQIQQVLKDLADNFGLNCDPGALDGKNSNPTKRAVIGFQNECNARLRMKLSTDGDFGKNSWNGMLRMLSWLLQLTLKKPGTEEPAWQTPDYHPKWTDGTYPNGEDFPDGGRSMELNLFHPSDPLVLKAPVSGTPLTNAENPVEDPAKFRKVRIPLEEAPKIPAINTEIAIETYDPKDSKKVIEVSGPVVEVKQYVNRISRPGFEGRDGWGDTVKLRIVSKGFGTDPVTAKPLPAQIFVKAIFSAEGGHAKRSKRNNPAWLLVKDSSMEAVVEPASKNVKSPPADGWVYSATVNVPEGQKSVLVELRLGLAGGDNCEFQVGATNACDAARIKLVNWRKLWYQLTYRDGIVPPSMTKAEDKAKPVFIEFSKQPVVKHHKQTAGKVVVGNHNAAEYHALLKTDHPGQCVNIILCDEQIDGLSGGVNRTLTRAWDFSGVTGNVNMNDPANTIIVRNPPVQAGANLLVSGTWSNPATGKAGNLTLDPAAVTADVGLVVAGANGNWTITLPANATPSNAHKVRVTVVATAASGPWGGDGGTPPHNLIVIDADNTIHTMCVLHELGHLMNMTPYPGSYKAPPGLTLAEHTDAYVAHGGAGSHCKWEIESTIPDAALGGIYQDGHCIMFHQLTTKTKLVFCPKCAPFVKAQALRTFGDLKG
ncbi:MAG TPA: hypothetical protein PKY05_02800 [Fibrobacteria bacterium]|nr:hypothetical protein [Fibrobacteria bacterium]